MKKIPAMANPEQLSTQANHLHEVETSYNFAKKEERFCPHFMLYLKKNSEITKKELYNHDPFANET
jgi:hypothetical protein